MGPSEHIIIFTTLVIVSWCALLFIARGLCCWVYHHVFAHSKHG